MPGPILPPRASDLEPYLGLVHRKEWREAYHLLGEGLDVQDSLQIRFVLEFGAQMPDEDYWYLVQESYKHAFRGLDAVTNEQLRWLFTSRPGIESLMSDDERCILTEFDESMPLYRGYHDPSRLYRFSWTPHERNAARFALLWHDLSGGDPMIAKATVRKGGVLIVWHYEAEAIVDPDYINLSGTYPVPERYWALFKYEDAFRKRFHRDPCEGYLA